LADGIASDTITEYTILPMSISGYNEYGLFFITRLAANTPDLEEEEPHRTSNYQMPSKEGCTADLPLQLPYASTNYQAPSVEECTKKQTLQTPADQELYVPQTLTPGRPHYQTYDASAANGGPEVRARMIPS
ncbi:hypothetical protein A1F96_11048, partial [Pyrenophora tritici-repentis]